MATPSRTSSRHVVALRDDERARRSDADARGPHSHRAADAYLVRRGSGRTIVAGYPWFTDWGRDTFIALRGLCLSTGRLDDARDILVEWSGAVSEGMLPNRFADGGDRPEFNAVDASLWFIIAVQDYCDRAARAGARTERARTQEDDGRGAADPRRLRARHALRHPAR